MSPSERSGMEKPSLSNSKMAAPMWRAMSPIVATPGAQEVPWSTIKGTKAKKDGAKAPNPIMMTHNASRKPAGARSNSHRMDDNLWLE